jgi:hypothetical protein
MKHRDATAFKRFLARGAIFINGNAPLRGPDGVMAASQKVFDDPEAPCSWAPDLGVVLPGGHLAPHRAAPVRGAAQRGQWLGDRVGSGP